MSAEPARRPDEEDASTQANEPAEEVIQPSVEASESAPDPSQPSERDSGSAAPIDPGPAETETLTPEAATEGQDAVDTEAAWTGGDGSRPAPDTTATTDDAAGGTAAGPAAGEVSTAEASSAGGASSTADSVPTATAVTEAHKGAAHRRVVFLAGLGRALGIAFGLALFGIGIAFGMSYAQANRPAPVVTDAIDGQATPPPVAQEFIHSLALNDMDALRSSLDAQPHRDITSELQRFNIQRIERVETLKTQVDGNRSATGIMLITESTDGSPFTINLVILVDGGKIEGFR